jgi:hypothetical protein
VIQERGRLALDHNHKVVWAFFLEAVHSRKGRSAEHQAVLLLVELIKARQVVAQGTTVIDAKTQTRITGLVIAQTREEGRSRSRSRTPAKLLLVPVSVLAQARAAAAVKSKEIRPNPVPSLSSATSAKVWSKSAHISGRRS